MAGAPAPLLTNEMNQNQQTVLTNDPDVTIASPRFDVEATITAKPVEPLARRAANQANAAVGRVVSLSNRRRSLLVGMFVASALLVGVAGGFALALYRHRQTADAASSANLAAPPEATASQSHTAEDARAVMTQTTAAAKPETSNSTRTDAPVATAHSRETRAASDDAATTHRHKGSDDKSDRTTSTDERNSRKPERAANAPIEDNRSRAKDERERRREERAQEKSNRQEERASRREARAIDRVGDVLENRPRRVVQRNAPEPRRVDRIRDIFEGRQP
ncbi:MAG: hypothetical protein H0V88_01420 [Pyrinomonadaceae bacterium]|nr:hypothetical protein [Pyrinomonadaceae bacterium]